MKPLTKFWIWLLMFAVVVGLCFTLWSRMSTSPSVRRAADIEVLPPCPDRSPCVTSSASSNEPSLQPFTYDSSLEEAQQRLRIILLSQPRSKLVVDRPGYLAAEFRYWGIGFIDDIEFLFDENRKIVHFRAAARIGWTDFGVNRRRMQGIRDVFETTAPQPAQLPLPPSLSIDSLQVER